MVRRRKRQLWAADGKTTLGETGKTRAGLKVMQQMAVDREQRNAAAELGNNVRRPDFVE
jgi:hypothetical protein